MVQLAARRKRSRKIRKLATVQKLFARPRPPQAAVTIQYPPVQSPAEERVNGLTHAIAALAALLGGIWLILASPGSTALLSTLGHVAFSGSMFAVFAMSALSHLVEAPRQRQLFRTLDQAAIYLYSAGSCTPYFITFLIPQGWGWMLPAVWGLAILGAWDKLRGSRINSVSVGMNLLLGWFPILAAKPLFCDMPAGCVWIVVAAASSYMLGLVFLLNDEQRRYFHALWHLLVMAGSALTYAGALLYTV